ncbi:hypothetical protein C8J55DRAFT_391575, partial [Lentinula edodes]
CRPCNRSFALQSSLVEHYRGSEAHPTCPKCGKGFENRRSFDEVGQRDDIFQHYLESPSHPTCHQCRVGFNSLSAPWPSIKLAVLHANVALCKQCGRQYENVAELQQHYLTSIRHPTCSACEIGF